jgi:hypothetical protein
MTQWLTAWHEDVPSAGMGGSMAGMDHGMDGMMSDQDMKKLLRPRAAPSSPCGCEA